MAFSDDALDDRFGDVRLWRDLNQDGVSQEAELFTLPDLGIAGIDLNSRATNTNHGDAVLVHFAERTRQVLFRYVDASGEVTRDSNPNGSVANVAGLCNEARNVVGLMPHPEHAVEELTGPGTDGLGFFTSLVEQAFA